MGEISTATTNYNMIHSLFLGSLWTNYGLFAIEAFAVRNYSDSYQLAVPLATLIPNLALLPMFMIFYARDGDFEYFLDFFNKFRKYYLIVFFVALNIWTWGVLYDKFYDTLGIVGLQTLGIL